MGVSPAEPGPGLVPGVARTGASSKLAHAQAALAETEARFGLLARLAPVGIVQSDPAGRVVFVNDRWCAMTGVGAAEMLGTDWLDLVHPDDRGRVERDLAGGAREGEVQIDGRLYTPSGAEVWVQGFRRGPAGGGRQPGRAAGGVHRHLRPQASGSGMGGAAGRRTGRRPQPRGPDRGPQPPDRRGHPRRAHHRRAGPGHARQRELRDAVRHRVAGPAGRHARGRHGAPDQEGVRRSRRIRPPDVRGPQRAPAGRGAADGVRRRPHVRMRLLAGHGERPLQRRYLAGLGHVGPQGTGGAPQRPARRRAGGPPHRRADPPSAAGAEREAPGTRRGPGAVRRQRCRTSCGPRSRRSCRSSS